MTDDMFPGQDWDPDRFRAPGAVFADEFGDEPPLVDMVPRALAVYERSRRRRQAAGVGGAVAAVAATVLFATQLLGGATPQGTDSPGGAGGPGGAATSANPTSTRSAPPSPPTSAPAVAPPGSPTSSAASPKKPAGGPCDQTLALQDAPDIVPVPNQDAAQTLCVLGMTTMPKLLPGHTWLPAPDRFQTTPGTYLPYSFAPDGLAGSSLALDISTKPYFSAMCKNVWYPRTTCREVTLADGRRGIEFDTLPGGQKPGGYELDIDLRGGRQLRFATGYQGGAPQPVTLDAFLKLVQSSGFAQYLKQYEAIMGS